jgi:hypothetical protein
MALVRNGENPLDRTSVFRMLERSMREKRVDGGEASVTCPDAVASGSFRVLQERTHHCSVEVIKAEIGGLPASQLLAEREQQTKRVAVCGHRVRTGGTLLGEAVDEERL